MEFYNMYCDSRVSAKTCDGEIIRSHMQGEPFFFTFGKNEVSKLYHIIYIAFSFSFDILGLRCAEGMNLYIPWVFELYWTLMTCSGCSPTHSWHFYNYFYYLARVL